MNKAHTIGTVLTVTMNGKAGQWTKLDRETWRMVGGTEGADWVSWERPDMIQDIKRINADIRKATATGNIDTLEASMDELERATDNIRLMDRFFPELAR